MRTAPSNHLAQGRVDTRIVVRAFRVDPAGAQHHEAVGLQRERQVVQHADHGLRAREPLQQAHQRHLVRRIEVGGRLVEQQDRRLHRERARDQRTLPLAARQRVQPAVLPAAALGRGHRGIDDALVLGVRHGEQAEPRQAAEVHGLAHREVAAGLALLRQPRDALRALARRPRVEPPAVQRDLPGARRQQPGQRAQQRRLAGAVRADDRGPARADVERQVVQHRVLAERDAQALRLQAGGRTHGSAAHAAPRRCSSHSR